MYQLAAARSTNGLQLLSLLDLLDLKLHFSPLFNFSVKFFLQILIHKFRNPLNTSTFISFQILTHKFRNPLAI